MNNLTQDPLSACILWFAKNHGVTTTYAAITEGLPLVNGAVTPSLFSRAAARIGFTSHLQQQALAKINTVLLPCVLLLKDNKACILQTLNTDTKRAVVVFPELSMQPTELALEQLVEVYSGIVIYCRAQFKPEPSTRPSAATLRQGHWFWSVILQNRRVYRDVLIAAIFINLFALAMPLFVMNVYDRVVPNKAIDTLWVLALGVGIIICADLLLKLLRSWFVELAANRADSQLSAYVMERILGGRLKYAPTSIGSFAANVQSFESVRSFIGSMTITALIDLPFFLLFALIIGLISWYMVIPVLVGAVLIILYALSVQSKMQVMSEAIGQASAQRNSGLIESLSANETIKSFNATQRMQRSWEQTTSFLSGCSSQMRLLGASVGMSAAWIQQLVAVAMIILGVYLVVAGEMSQGALIASYMLSSRAMAPISQAASLLTQYYQAATSLTSLEEMMKNEQERPAGKQFVSRAQIRGDIEFKNVSFSYPNEERRAVKNLSFKIKAGESVAILGRVGSGKSTIEKLILGLYQPTEGQVLIDGVHIEQIDPAELRRQISYIPQEPQLLSGTVYENIVLGMLQPSSQQVLKAVELAGLAPLVGSHADGLSMPVGENGSRLSGGQRQAIAAARAFVREGNIMLLDEPSSAMDSMLEQHLCQSIETLSREKTLLLITHKTSLLSLVERLMVLDNGQLVADGRKDTVLKALAEGSIQKVSA